MSHEAPKMRVCVANSGTEPLCRVMVEGPSKEITEKLAQSISEAEVSELG